MDVRNMDFPDQSFDVAVETKATLGCDVVGVGPLWDPETEG